MYFNRFQNSSKLELLIELFYALELATKKIFKFLII